MKRIVIKVGSNVLTREDGKLDVTRMSAIVDQIVWLRRQGYQVIVVSSGAVACGRNEVKVEHPLDSVEQRQFFSALGQVKLMELYYDLFREFQVHVGQVLTMKESFSTREEYLNQKACVSVMLENGVVPIVNENDTISVTELMFTDNDELSGLMATMMACDELVLLTNVDGIYDGDPSDAQSQLIPTVEPDDELMGCVSSSKSAQGRGGMLSKCKTARKVADEGIRVTIANGKRDNILIDLVTRPAEVPHTEFTPRPGATIHENEWIGNEQELSPEMEERLAAVRSASKSLGLLTDDQRRDILQAVAKEIRTHQSTILQANAEDLARMSPENPLYDRLMLNSQRLEGIAQDMEKVALLPSPLGRVLKESTLENGLHLRRVSVPYGVIGIIYEARPNVTFDVFSLCFKSGNACVLKGGKDADATNRAEVELIHRVLEQWGVSAEVVELLPATHEATAQMLGAVDYIDLCIPRGGKRLITMVRNTARVPVIETGAGVVHCYFDDQGDTQMGQAIITNAKTRRPSVCNTLDTLLIHQKRLGDLPALLQGVQARGVMVYADEQAYEALQGNYPDELLRHATEECWDTEWMSLKMGIRTVEHLEEALQHIARHGSGHSECIVSQELAAQRRFKRMVDAACVYVNAPISFTDGAQFGLGAEIGISTQKLGARGPMALEEITTYKWLIEGEGQTRA